MSEILNLIHQITANGDSGRLEVLAGAIQGELSFANGKLVDARVADLSGFRAVNAVVAMRDARFGFDPSFAPIASNSISASERVVLKQFFGIETGATAEYFEPIAQEVTPQVAAHGPAGRLAPPALPLAPARPPQALPAARWKAARPFHVKARESRHKGTDHPAAEPPQRANRRSLDLSWLQLLLKVASSRVLG